MNAPVDVTDIRIETNRLVLRAWRETDLEDFYEYARVDGVGQMAGWMPHQSIEESERILSHFIAEKKTFALEEKATGKVIGSLGLEPRDENLRLPETFQGREIGYVLSKDYWGRGLMPEAVEAVIRYCFGELKFDYLTCGHFISNSQSRRVIEKCGFHFLGESLFEIRFGTVEPTKNYILYNPRKVTAPFDVTGIRIETERLLLRELRESDLPDFFEIVSVPEIADMDGWECMETMDAAREFLNHHLERKETFAVVLKENGKLVGTFSPQARYWEEYPLDYTLRGREFGFDLNRDYWGRGLMPETLRAVTDYCFETLHYDFVTCGHFIRNARSGRVIEKCGFTFLFEAEHDLPTGKTERIRTYIQYNPHKEKQYV